MSTDPDTEDNSLCEPDSLASFGDLAGSVVLAPRDTCIGYFQQLQEQNASAILFLNSNSPRWTPYIQVDSVDGPYVNAAVITYDEAASLLKALASGAQVSADFGQQRPATQANKDTPGLASTYTTVGPTWEMLESVHVSAPGGNILSTWPMAMGGYSILSGTSMAAPMVAGVPALLISKQGKDAVKDIRSQLSSTAVPFKQVDSDSPESTARSGSGLVDAFAAVTGILKATPSALALGDLGHFNGTQSIEVFNFGSQDASFDVTHVPAATLLTADPTSGEILLPPIPIDPSAVVDAVPSQTTVTVPAGQSQTI